MTTKLESMAKQQQVEARDLLRQLKTEFRKPDVIALHLGVTNLTVYRWFHQHGVELPGPAKFEMQGVSDTFEGHCKRAGVTKGQIATRMSRKKITAAEAITEQVASDMRLKRGQFKAIKNQSSTSGLPVRETGLLGTAAEAKAA